MPEDNRNRLDWIDTLRGIAVLFVFGLHSMLDAQRHAAATGAVVRGLDLYATLTFGWLDFGKIGVGIFFIVSGFLIPVTLDKPSSSAMQRFLVNRVFRLYPAYWLSIAVLLIVTRTELSPLQILVNLTMMQRFVGVPDLNGVFWTLQIELVFYTLCIALKASGQLGSKRVLNALIAGFGILAMGLAAVRFHTSIKLPVALLLALQLMFFGYLYRLWLFNRGVRRSQMLAMLCVVVLTIAIACPLAYSHDYGLGERWQRYLASYWFAIAVFMACSRLRLRSVGLAFVGRISYSFYLLHTICLSLLLLPAAQAAIPLASPMGLMVYISASLGLAMAASWISFKLIEEPGVAIGHRLAAKLGSMPAVTPTRADT